MFSLFVGLWLSMIPDAEAAKLKEHQIRAGVCAGYESDCQLLRPQLEYANNRFVIGVNSLLGSSVYGKVYLNNHPRYKASLGLHHGTSFNFAYTYRMNGVVASTDILFKRLTVRLSAGHLLSKDGYPADLGNVTYSASAMYNFSLMRKGR